MGGSFVKTVLLAVLLVLLCAACDGPAEESRKSGNIEPITTGQGANREDTQGEAGSGRGEPSPRTWRCPGLWPFYPAAPSLPSATREASAGESLR